MSHYFSNMVKLYSIVAIIVSRHNIKCDDPKKIGFSRVWVGVQNFILITKKSTKYCQGLVLFFNRRPRW
jgi:hypothetical protein